LPDVEWLLKKPYWYGHFMSSNDADTELGFEDSPRPGRREFLGRATAVVGWAALPLIPPAFVYAKTAQRGWAWGQRHVDFRGRSISLVGDPGDGYGIAQDRDGSIVAIAPRGGRNPRFVDANGRVLAGGSQTITFGDVAEDAPVAVTASFGGRQHLSGKQGILEKDVVGNGISVQVEPLSDALQAMIGPAHGSPASDFDGTNSARTIG
jgi:hypothetical protein